MDPSTWIYEWFYGVYYLFSEAPGIVVGLILMFIFIGIVVDKICNKKESNAEDA